MEITRKEQIAGGIGLIVGCVLCVLIIAAFKLTIWPTIIVGFLAGFICTYAGILTCKLGGGSADADLLPDLPTLVERSRDLIRNNPLAAGAINTKVTNVIGTGLKLTSSIDRAVLNMTDDKAEVLCDIFANHESPEKITINCDPMSRNVVITIEDLDDEWFKELQAAGG